MSMIITNDFPRFLSINLSYGSLYEFIDLVIFSEMTDLKTYNVTIYQCLQKNTLQNTLQRFGESIYKKYYKNVLTLHKRVFKSPLTIFIFLLKYL